MSLEEIAAALRLETERLDRLRNELRLVVGGETSPSSSADKERLNEYEFLRKELESTWSQTYTTLNFILAFIVVATAAALSKELGNGNRHYVFVSASLVTWGGYGLIFTHSRRVWRVVAYMRTSLEPNLKGIRWETRLAARMKVLSGKKRGKPSSAADLDDSIFDGQTSLLHFVNCALLFGIVVDLISAGWFRAVPVPAIPIWVTQVDPFLSLLTPVAAIVFATWRQRHLRRGRSAGESQLVWWALECPEYGNAPAYALEPSQYSGDDSVLKRVAKLHEGGGVEPQK